MPSFILGLMKILVLVWSWEFEKSWIGVGFEWDEDCFLLAYGR